MLQFVVRRLLFVLPTMVAASILVFLMLHLVPGDPAIIFFGDQPVTPERLEMVRHQMGLDRPLVIQYLDFVRGIPRGDLGRSIHNRTPVFEELRTRVASSATLALAAFAVAGVLGLRLGWFPATGYGGWNRLVLPAVALGFVTAATLARLVRSSVLDVLLQPFVTTARAKGLREAVVIRRHVLKNAFIGVITVMGLQFGTLLSGAVITATVFARPGVGKLLVDAISNKDFPVVQGAVLFIALVYIVLNLVVDLSYAYLDPRIRFD